MPKISDLKAKRLQKKLAKRFAQLGWDIHFDDNSQSEVSPFSFILADTRIHDFLTVHPRAETLDQMISSARSIDTEIAPMTPNDLLCHQLQGIRRFDTLDKEERDAIAIATMVVALQTTTFATLVNTSNEGALVVVVYADSRDDSMWTRYGGIPHNAPSIEEVRNVVTSILEFAKLRTPEHFGRGQVLKFEPKNR